MEELLKGVADFGFPAVLSIFLLVRMEGKIEKLSESITELSNSIESMKK